MSALRASTNLEKSPRYEPRIARQAKLALVTRRDNFIRLDTEPFAASPNVLVDYWVMERIHRVAVLAARDLRLSDIGSYDALAAFAERLVRRPAADPCLSERFATEPSFPSLLA
ncbi:MULTISPECIES: hypothetical protein [Paraburkholderia]|uniref:hypothetical protein n=1 Tax=Paraburkholderia TaxID=1822464 RepID=UPI0032186612